MNNYDNYDKSKGEKKQITATINNIFRNYDKNGREYLLLKLDKQHPTKSEPLAIFCFGLNERWGELAEGDNYNFEVWYKTDRGTHVLDNFTKI